MSLAVLPAWSTTTASTVRRPSAKPAATSAPAPTLALQLPALTLPLTTTLLAPPSRRVTLTVWPFSAPLVTPAILKPASCSARLTEA
ncbi:hypothetical protein D9M68_762740 [compost metagenome]